MKQSTFSAVMANSIKHLLQGYTKSIRFVAVLTMLLTMGIGQAWGETWEKVTSAPSDWSGDYLIVYEDGKVAFDGSRTTLDAASNTFSVTISNGKITTASTTGDTKYFTIAKSGTSYTIKSKSGYYIGQTSNDNGLKSSTSTTYSHTISLNNDKTVNLVSGSAYLRYNSASDQKRFRYYKSSSYTNQKAIQLYKKVAATPTLTVSKTSLSISTKVGASKTGTFTFSGSNLTSNATLTISGTHAGYFKVNPTSKTLSSGSIATTTATVTYSPEEYGTHTATLTVKSGTASKTVTLNGTATCSYNINYTTNNEPDGDADAIWSKDNCFEQVGSTTEWRYEMTLPGGGGSFWVGNGAWVDNKSEVHSLSSITFVGLQGTSCGSKPYPGVGAVGYVRIYSDSGSKNYYAAFQPTYQIAFGIEGQTWTHKPFTLVSGNKYETDLVEIPSNFSSSYNYYVGPKKSDNTTIWVDGKSSTVAMNTMGGMTDVNAVKGSKGVFRIYDNSCDNNWYCSFIPYYNYKLLNDDGSVFYTSDYVSSEAANKTTTIYSTKPTKTGYTFVGWSRTQNATTAEVTAGASYTYWKANDTFYPVWKANYTVTFNLQGHGTAIAQQTVVAGNKATRPADPSETGYTFGGWYKESACTNVFDFNTVINANTTIYAQWTAKKYTYILYPNTPAGATVIFKDKAGTSVDKIQITQTYGEAAQSFANFYSEISCEGYRFEGWYSATSGGSKWTQTQSKPADNGVFNFYAHWTKVHTITWKVNKQTYTKGSPTTSVDDGATYKNLTLPTAPVDNTLDECYTGKKFVGWSTTNIGSTESSKPSILFKSTSEAPSTAITENKTLYAVFATESPTTSTSSGKTTISGAASGTITNVLSWSSDQNDGTAITAWNGDGHFRLYPNKSNGNGSSITIKPISGITINEVVLTATSGTYAKPVKYNIDGGSDVSGTWNDTKMTISDINAISSFKFRNAHTGANNDQVRVTVSVTYLKEISSTKTSNYVTECCTLNNITLDGSGTTTGGTFSATASKACEGEEITLSATAAECYAFDSWTIKKTSDGSDVTNSVLNGNTLIMPDYAVTVYATFKSLSVTGITLSMTGGEHKNLDVGETNQLLVAYTPTDATCDKEIVSWTSSDDNVISVTNSGLVTALRSGNATITATTAAGVSNTYTIVVNNPACEAWYLHYWNASTGGDECFYKVKPDDPNDHEWRTNNFSLPSFSDEDKFIVNNTPEDPYKTDQVFRTGIGFADIQRGGQNCGTNPYPGQDAYGQLSIYDDSNSPNRYIAFYPAQYLVTYGKDGAAPWEVLPLNNTTGYEYETEPFMVPNGYKTDATYKYWVGITKHNGSMLYVDGKSSVDAMNTVSGLSVSDMAGKWGVWHIYSNSCANNWYGEFIRYYRVDFDLAGGEGDIAPRYGKAAEPYAKFSTSDITAPTRDGYTFLGWKDQNNKIYAPTGANVTINNDLTLTALWVEEYGSDNCRWEEVTIDDIVYGDEVVIATYKNGYTYALKDNDGEASTAPLAVKIIINPNNTINTSETPISTPLIWNIDYDKEGTKNLVIYSTKNVGKWLYSNAANDGVRIGDNTNKEFKIVEGTDDDAGNFFLYHIAQNRYLGVYIQGSNWRGYTSINSQITGQTLKFYKKVCLPEGQYRVTWDANGGAWSDGSTTKEEIYSVGANIKNPEKPELDGYIFDSWEPTPSTMPAENTTFTAKWAELYTVNFYSNGTEVCSFEEGAGQTVNCTNTPTTCDDEYPHFIGWTDTEIDGVATDKPALVTLPLTVSESQDYHAVFAKGTLATGGDAETVTFANSGYSNQQTISAVTLTNATITFAKGSNNNNAPKYYTTGAAIRCYGGNTFTVTSNNEITKISLTFATGEDGNKILASTGTYSNGTWTGSAKSITFTIDGSSGHRRIASISVTAGSPENLTEFITSCCTPWAAPTLSANTSIAVGGTTTITYSGTTYGDVTYTSSNTDVATVDANGKVTGVKPGKTTITASWDGVDGSGNYCPAEATIDVTVTGSFTITYDANHASATGATTATTIAYPTGQGTVATNGFALAEHQFVKWNTSADGSGTSYSEGASITLTDDITLYAIWQRYCTITYVIPAGGGTLAAGATTTVVAGGAVQMPGIENNSIDLEYSCENLIGWTTNSATHEAAGLKPDPFYAIGASLSGITQNTTLYAVYSRAGNGLGGTVTLTAEEMEGWATAQSYGTERELTTCVGTWKTTGVKSTGNPIQLRATDNPYVEFPELQGNITQVVLNATNGSNATLTSGTFTLKTIDGQTITSASVNSSGVCTLTVTGSHKTARLYSSVTARIANISISYGPAAIISTTLSCTNDIDECTVTYDLNESFLAVGTQVLGFCTNSTFRFSEIGEYTICSEPQANEYRLIGWNNQCDGKGSLTFTPGQVISSLPQNIITLYAQWVPEVIVHDSYEETKVYPTEMGGSITLNPGQYICDPQKYEFIGWTTEDPQLWQQQNISPTLLEENQDGTVTFTPTEPSQVYAVYAIEDMANSDAFRLSLVVNGNTYYLGYASSRIKATTIDDAFVLYKETINASASQYRMYYVDGNSEKQYVYCNSVGNVGTSDNPSENWGWTITKSGTGYTFTSINYTSGPNMLKMNESNVSMATSGSVFNMETVAEYKYVAKTNCSETVTITFVPGNGTMTPSDNPVIAKTGDVINLPTCVYEGWDFLGWVTENIELTEFEIEPSRLYTETYEVGNSDVPLYAYYTQIPESAEFDGTTSEVYKMYCEVDDKYYYAISHGSSRPGTLPSSNICLNAEEWVFTNTGEANVYYIQDHNNLYLTPEVNNTQLFFTSTPFPWKVVEIGTTNTYRIYAYNTRNDDYSRLIMFQSGAFYHSAKNNEGNSAWHHVTIGGCQNPVYTTDPQPSKIFNLIGSPMITSTINQTVKASQQLQLVLKDMEANTSVTIAGDGLTFYDADNNEVTTLQTGPNGSLTATLTVAYTPTVADNRIVNPAITVTCGSASRTFYNVACRSLPETFVIAAKTGNAWVALTANIQRSGTQEAELIQVDNITTPTKATITPNTTKYQLFGLQNNLPSQANSRYKNNGTAVHLYSTNQSEVISASTFPDTKTYINADATRDNAARSANALFYEWQLTTNDLVHYNIVNSNTQNTSNTKLGYSANSAQWGMYANGANVNQEVVLLPVEKEITEMDVEVMEWGASSMALRFGESAPATIDITLGETTKKAFTLSSTSDIYTVDGLTLTSNDGEAILIIDASNENSGKFIRKPILLHEEKSASTYTREVCMHTDIVILNGGKLIADESINSHVDFANIYVYPGGKLVLDGNSLGVKQQVYLRGGYSWLNQTTYALPEVYLNGEINFNGSGNMIYDYYIQNHKYYQFALPYNVQLANVTDEAGKDNFPVWVKHYNGALRADDANATSWEWYPSEGGDPTESFIAGEGYIIAAKPRQDGNTANRPLSIIRFPLGNKAFNETNGIEMEKSVTTIAHGIDGYKAGTVTANNVGWNFIGNPYLSTWKGDIGHKQLTKYPNEANWDGTYNWVEAPTKYITIMSPEDGTDYAQYVASNTELKPFFPFYMQETADGREGTITFTLTNRMKKAPAEILAAIVREAFVQIEIVDGDNIDQTGLYVSDKYSDDIDFDDLEKMFGTATDKAKAWFVHDSKRMAFESMTENRAAGSIPLGYRAPQEGTYTFTINEEISELDCIENIYLTDYENGIIDYDLLLSDYKFESQSVLYNDTRFTVRIIMKEKGEGTVTGVDYIGVQDELPIKFIYQDKIFILHNETIYDATGKKVTTINK